MSNELPQFTIKQLLEAGVHFGHKVNAPQPKCQNIFTIIEMELALLI